jgi:hypothetical protein
VTAGQTLDPEAKHSQPLFREVDLPMFKGIFVAATDKERKLIPIDLEQPAKVEPVALRFVISRKTGDRGTADMTAGLSGFNSAAQDPSLT